MKFDEKAAQIIFGKALPAIILYASEKSDKWDPALHEMMLQVADGLRRYEAGNYRMTDDKAPVELLSMRAIDAIIKEEVDYYKKIYREEGLQGLIDRLF